MLLLVFLLLSSSFAFSHNHSFSIKSAPTTPQDQFHAISIHAPKKEEPPICCLVPLPPLPGEGSAVEEDAEEVLLSFGEWKEKEREKQMGRRQNVEKQNDTTEEADTSFTDEHPPEEPSESTVDLLPLDSQERLSPHFQVPLTDRFNYASLDCSARVHTAHRSAKSPSNILSSKRDRYLLSPCAPSEQQFVVVELCDDIRIDTVQLANFEFFSGVFRDFTVSVAKTYVGEGEKKKNDWVVAGSYRAKNFRGVQSFHPPRSLTDFYRFIRIDFHSHYSNEYYCPISLLRVYGLTHLEEWKWEIWEAESKAKREQELPGVTIQRIEDEDETFDSSELFDDISNHHPPYIVGVTTTSSSLSSATSSVVSSSSLNPSSHSAPAAPGSVLISESSSSFGSSASDGSTVHDSISRPDSSLSTPTSTSTPIGLSSEPTSDSIVTHESVATSLNDVGSDTADSTIPVSVPSTTQFSNSHHSSTPSSATSNENASSHSLSASSHSHLSSASMSAPQFHGQSHIPYVPPVSPIVPVAGSGESIYRTIMNRLGALEGNHSLYTRYVEQQTTTIRHMLSRLSEDVGRLEGIRKSQAQAVWRIQKEREKERKERTKLELEFMELVSRVEYLSDEIILEKRLGIAQICILLTVIVFMGLTRGSRGTEFDHHHSHGVNFSRSALGGRWKDGVYIKEGMREWGRRHLRLSLSGLSAFSGRSSRSQSRSGGNEKEESALGHGNGNGEGKDQQRGLESGEESSTLRNGQRNGNFSAPAQSKLAMEVKRERHEHGHEQEHEQLKFEFPTSPSNAGPISPSSSYNLSSSDKRIIHATVPSEDSSHSHGQSTNHFPYSPTYNDHRRAKTAGLFSYSSYWGADSRSSRSRSHSRSRTPSKTSVTGASNKSTTTPSVGMKTPRTPTRKSRPQLRRSNSESHGSTMNVPSAGYDPMTSSSGRLGLSPGFGIGEMGPGSGPGPVALGLTPSASWGAGGSGGQVPRSVKRWARTAHLHEVKRKRDKDVDKERDKRQEGDNNKENTNIVSNGNQNGEGKEKEKTYLDDDVFSSTSPSQSKTGSLVSPLLNSPMIVTPAESQRSPLPLTSSSSPTSSQTRRDPLEGVGEDDTDAWDTETDAELDG